MTQGNDRVCDGCGQKLPQASKLSRATVSSKDAAALGVAGDPSPDGTVVIDLCLNCRVKRSYQEKHGYS